MAKESGSKSQNKTENIIIAIAIIAIGVLFCVSLRQSLAVISWIIGIICILAGLEMVIPTLAKYKRVFSVLSIGGLFVIGFGIFFIVAQLAGILVQFIPILLITLGSALILDAFLLIIVHKSKDMFSIVLELVFGIVAVTLGILLLFVEGFKEYASLVFGISLIVYGAYILIVELFIKK